MLLVFFGDVLNTRRGQNSIYVPKSGVLVFTLFRHFFAHFLGDLLYFIKFRLFMGGFKYFAYNIYQTGLKRQDDEFAAMLGYDFYAFL